MRNCSSRHLLSKRHGSVQCAVWLLLCAGSLCAQDAPAPPAQAPTTEESAAEDRGDGKPASFTLGTDGHTRPDLKNAVVLTLDDVSGTYTIPYIQAPGNLTVRVEAGSDAPLTCKLKLVGPRNKSIVKEITPENSTATFERLPAGEYSLQARGRSRGGAANFSADFGRIGLGTIVAAIGDSITEGYWGNKLPVPGKDLNWTQFAAERVSRDGRNFPQFGPTSAANAGAPQVFQSWLTELNDLLAKSLKQPVFIANEGWGGITSGGYLEMMNTDAKWQARMRQLQPAIWLIHLGVNDERAKVPAATFRQNMDGIIERLLKDYHAEPAQILIARPCYDYAEGAAEILTAYNAEIAGLIAAKRLSAGPDFFTAYATDKERWYGSDPVHPNIAGTTYMAELWQASIVKARGRKR